MDNIAIKKIHGTISKMGFSGTKEELFLIIKEVEENTVERRVLYRWKEANHQAQYKAIKDIYAHAKKHSMDMNVFEKMSETTFVLSRRHFLGIRLGLIDVSEKEIRYCFYKGNKNIGEKAYQFT